MNKTACQNCSFYQVSAAGVECLFCEAGFEPNEERTACLPCAPGYYSNSGMPWLQPTCAPCPGGTEPYTRDTPSPGCRYCVTKGRGFANVDYDIMCHICPAGQQPLANTSVGLPQSECVNCPAGSIRRGALLGNIDDLGDKVCEYCPSGTEVKFSRTACAPCQPRHAGQDGVCNKCASGRVRAEQPVRFSTGPAAALPQCRLLRCFLCGPFADDTLL